MNIVTNTTVYHAKYWARLLTVDGSPRGSVAQLGRTLASARLDLNPHQIDAALFAIRSPLSQGCMLADEVGLGKTIEAGLVIAQRWAERRRRILLILPATLRKQWQLELAEKFGLPSEIIEGRSYNLARKNGHSNPFHISDHIVICSYPFAARKAEDLLMVPWDLVVLDEAHRLRNVWKTNAKQAPAIKAAIEGRQKILLTATPLQNSLMELYGLVSFIDDHVFGDIESFKERFVHGTASPARSHALRERLAAVCTRTLRRDVLEYVRFTNRIPITQEFYPSNAEQELYDAVSVYLQKEILAALPNAQRALMTLILRRLLASSTFAIAGTLRRLANRLERQLKELPLQDIIENEAEDYEGIDETADEWHTSISDSEAKNTDGTESTDEIDPKLIADELIELRHYADQAEAITNNAKGDALLKALGTAFTKNAELGAERKAVIFTESRRTQDYLARFLADNGFAHNIVLINGSNTDPDSKKIYQAWAEEHAGSSRVSGSKTADMKAALVERFRDLDGNAPDCNGVLLIATESAAEGVNLQFCSLVVNYDLPWNPQRVEQRIGRCHRYGQKHDVVVVNFLNKRNEADQRVYELLAEKFQLFEGIFGASDEILGQLESGIDIERRIAAVYQTCRSPADITAAFDALQEELDSLIQSRMEDVRGAILEHFDVDVQERLRVHQEQALSVLDGIQRTLLKLTRHQLGDSAQFSELDAQFIYQQQRYHFDWRQAETLNAQHFAPEHKLAQECIHNALNQQCPHNVCLSYDLSGHPTPIAALAPYLGQRGWIGCAQLRVQGVNQENFMLLTAITENGEHLDQEQCRRLCELSVIDTQPSTTSSAHTPDENSFFDSLCTDLLNEIETRNGQFIDEESSKLERWADDLRSGLELELKHIDRDIKEAKKEARNAASLALKVAAQRQIKDMERKRNHKRHSLFEEQDRIEEKRENMIATMEDMLRQGHETTVDFICEWTLL